MVHAWWENNYTNQLIIDFRLINIEFFYIPTKILTFIPSTLQPKSKKNVQIWFKILCSSCHKHPEIPSWVGSIRHNWSSHLDENRLLSSYYRRILFHLHWSAPHLFRHGRVHASPCGGRVLRGYHCINGGLFHFPSGIVLVHLSYYHTGVC